ncbi:MAG: DUF4349 domain-containing protein [Hyphomonadaceae bacterium]|nr:DUF4349 domain-containing protein [Hyphomonadaceae bacterium]
MRGLWISLIAAVALAGCSPEHPSDAVQQATEAVEPDSPAEAPQRGESAAATDRADRQQEPQLAYEHEMRLVAPAQKVPHLLNSHQDACSARASGRCQIITALSSNERGEARATLELRAEAKWLAAFRASLAEELPRAGGRILETSTTSEDLTQQIIDVEARLRAQRTLRDRLQALLAGKPGKLAELLEVERELARVQGELDTAASTLKVYRTRVETELLTIHYQSAATAVGANAWSPLSDALGGVAGVLASSLAVLVTLVAALTPFVVLLLPVAWLVWRFLRRKQAPQKSAS